ncbi:MAG: glycoside hydrolase family 130 protein [Candidatus Bathyarchaeota archaeon]|nr:glycoside hydrolase family 130 protein [Candidatus Bathyarchaeota archaeon]
MSHDFANIGKSKSDLVERYEGNPIITSVDIPDPCNTVFNAGATLYKNKYILLLRVEDLEGKSKFYLAESTDGYDFEILNGPVFSKSPMEPFKTYEKRGVEDPRITKIGDTYYILYTAYSHFGPLIGLATTDDFQTFERIALISEPDNKDAALFSRQFNGKFVRLDRPASDGIWISYSSDLKHWGEARAVMEARPGHWDMEKIGGGTPPIETDKGWLEIYHGVKNRIYRLGCALFNLEDPSTLVGRSEVPILSPRTPYERTGDVPNVVFTCGAVLEQNTGEVKIYYGAADTYLCVCTANTDDLVKACLRNNT